MRAMNRVIEKSLRVIFTDFEERVSIVNHGFESNRARYLSGFLPNMLAHANEILFVPNLDSHTLTSISLASARIKIFNFILPPFKETVSILAALPM